LKLAIVRVCRRWRSEREKIQSPTILAGILTGDVLATVDDTDWVKKYLFAKSGAGYPMFFQGVFDVFMKTIE